MDVVLLSVVKEVLNDLLVLLGVVILLDELLCALMILNERLWLPKLLFLGVEDLPHSHILQLKMLPKEVLDSVTCETH